MPKFQCGIKHPRYIGLVKKQCKNCNEIITVSAKRSHSVRLCAQCHNEKYIGLIEKQCSKCGITFKVEPSKKESIRRCKNCGIEYKLFDRAEFLKKAGINTRFKKGENVGEKSVRWKGGELKIRLSKYGLSVNRYKEIKEYQKNVCAICGKTQKRDLNVDHNHKDGRVRGLLCFRCNFGLGWFQENIKTIENVLNYLKKPTDWRDLI